MRRITYTDVFRSLEPLNGGRDEKERITYNYLRVQAKRHYEIDGVVICWSAHLIPEFCKKLRDALVQESYSGTTGNRIKYEESTPTGFTFRPNRGPRWIVVATFGRWARPPLNGHVEPAGAVVKRRGAW